MNSRKKFKKSLKPTVLSLSLMSLLLPQMGGAYIAPEGYSSFSNLPLHLKSETIKSGKGVPPNILLQIDDSGSMNEIVPGSNKRRMEITRESLERLVTNPEYRGKVNWGMLTLCGSEFQKPTTGATSIYMGANATENGTIATPISPQAKPHEFPYFLNYKYARRLDTNPNVVNTQEWGRGVIKQKKPFAWDVDKQLVPTIRSLLPSCLTPSTERYFDAVHVLRANMNNGNYARCEKNYIVLFSDGEPNSSGLRMLPVAGKEKTWKLAPSWNAEGWKANKTQHQAHLLWYAHDDAYEFPMGKGKDFKDYPKLFLERDLWWRFYSPSEWSSVKARNIAIFSSQLWQLRRGSIYQEVRARGESPTDATNTWPNSVADVGPGIGQANPVTALYDPLISYKGSNWNGKGEIELSVSDIPHLQDFRQTGNNSKLPKALLNFDGGWAQRNDTLSYLADSVYYNDLMPFGKADKKDRFGKSFDGSDDNEEDAKKYKDQNITTFTIGFGLQSPYLDGGATGNGKQAFNAKNQKDLDEAFSHIIKQISDENQIAPPDAFSSISPTVSGDETETTQKLPNMAAAIRLSLKNGGSQIRFYKFKTVNGQSVLDAGADGSKYYLPDYSDRKILAYADNRGVMLDQLTKNNAYFGIESTDPNEWKTALIPWLYRRNVLGTAQDLSKKYRNRLIDKDAAEFANLGDVIASPITSYGPIKNNRQQFLVTAGNDGMVYLFESTTSPMVNPGDKPYKLRLNYMPLEMNRDAEDTMAKHLKDIAVEGYITDPTKPHQYLLNGGIGIRTTDRSSYQRHLLAGNMGQGGRGTYVINLGGKNRQGQDVGLDASDLATSVPLFETPKGAQNQMGYTLGSPVIARFSALARTDVSVPNDEKNKVKKAAIENVQYGVFVGNGVNNANNPNESALYVYSVLNENVGTGNASASYTQGQLVQKIVAPGGKGGLAQPTLVDTDLDGVVDVAYAGDYNGTMYRFDLRGTPESWKAVAIFQTARTNDGQPITSAPTVFRRSANRYIVIFGTGSDIYKTDASRKDQQAVYGVYDDWNQDSPAMLTPSNLVLQSLDTISSAQPASANDISGQRHNFHIRKIHKNATEVAEDKGWYINLDPAIGERVVVKPDLLLKTVLLVTRGYRENRIDNGNTNSSTVVDACSSTSISEATKGEGWILQVKAENGTEITNTDGDDYARVDVLRQGKLAPNARKEYAAIHEDDKGIPSLVNLLGDASSYIPDNEPKKITVDGKEIESNDGGINYASRKTGELMTDGKDITLQSKAKVEEVEYCFNTDGNKVVISQSDASAGTEDPLDILGKKCTNTSRRVIRISWREIF